MSQEKIKNIIEAALMVSTQPLSITRILSLFESDLILQPERNDIRAAVEELQQCYQERGIELVEVASGFRFQARDEYAQWVNHLFDERPPRYSRALLETLAIIAYRQPVTRSEIEDIRGVSVSGTIVKTLQERDWIKVVGHRDVPGKPELLATTKSFLDYFNLKQLSDLPALADIKDFDSINPDLFEVLEKEAKSNSEKTEEGSDNNLPESVNDTAESTDDETEIKAEVEADVDIVEEATVESITSESEEPEISDNEEDDAEEGAKVIPFSG
jgi:segregation and condensation protein B